MRGRLALTAWMPPYRTSTTSLPIGRPTGPIKDLAPELFADGKAIQGGAAKLAILRWTYEGRRCASDAQAGLTRLPLAMHGAATRGKSQIPNGMTSQFLALVGGPLSVNCIL